MKKILLIIALAITIKGFSQRQTENIIIITTDGFRWQEVFKGMDSAIANNSKYHQGNSEYIYKNYWAANVQERRKKRRPGRGSAGGAGGRGGGGRARGRGGGKAN